jgi:hypothetical protein
LDVKYEVAEDVKLEPETGTGNVNATGRNTEENRQGIRNRFLEVSMVNTPFYPSIMPPVPPWSALLRRHTLHQNSRLVAYMKMSHGGRMGTLKVHENHPK